MKKTKILVPALAVLALGMAASVTGTVAWYTATSNASVALGTAAMQNTVSGSESTVSELNLYAKFGVNVTSGTAALTSSDGYCYAVVNGYLQPATDPAITAKYATVSVQFIGWFSDAACNTAATNDEKARIAADQTLTIYVGGDNDPERSRVSLSAPANTSGFATAFGGSLGNRVSITYTFNAGGTVKTGDNTSVYVAISGEESLKTKAELDLLCGTNSGFKTDSSTVSQTIKVFSSAS